MVTAQFLLDSFDVFLLDAMGVLYYAQSTIPGAREFISSLKDRNKPYFVLTNGASKTPQQMSAFYASLGLEIANSQIISSGSLLDPWVKQHKLEGRKAFAIGPAEIHELLYAAKLKPLQPGESPQQAQVFVIFDQKCKNLLNEIDTLLSAIIYNIDRGVDIQLCLPNPDIYFNKSATDFGITAGSIALIIEKALQLRYGSDHPRFYRLGKPFSPIFDAAKQRYASASKAIMIGDQLETDILGAQNNGIDSCLIGTGITHLEMFLENEIKILPTYIMKNFLY